MVQLVNFPKQRRHTYYFLSQARNNAQVLLTTDIDMSSVESAKQQYNDEGQTISYIVFLIKAISTVIKRYPRANSSLLEGWWPKIALYDSVIAKFVLDKVSADERLVLSAVVKNSDSLAEGEIQKVINGYKSANYDNSPEFENIRKLNSLPRFLGKYLYRYILSNPLRRQVIQGSFTISSLGHRPVDAFFPISSNTLAFGAGAIRQKVIAQEGKPVVRAVMPLSMVFDHRVIDGAMAADILDSIKKALESYRVDKGQC